MALTGAAVLIASSTGLGNSESRPRGLDSDGAHLYAIGLSQRRLIKITDLETFASEYASASLSGNINSLAFNDGSFYYADNNNLVHRIDSPFDAQATGTSLSNITNSGQIRSLCSDGTDLFGYDKGNSILYRITDNGADVSATVFATVAFPTGTDDNTLSLFYFEDAFYLGNREDSNLWKLPDNLTAGSLDTIPVRVGNFTEFDVSERSPAGAGVLGSEAYFLGDDNNSLYRFLQTTSTNNEPVFSESSYSFDNITIAVGTIVGTVAATDADSDTLTYSLTGTDADKFDIDSDGEITIATALDYGESYAINVVADDGTDDTSVGVTIDAETVSPRAPTFVVDSVTEDSATITITAGDDGGESVSDWEYELDGDSTWVSFGDTDLEQTIPNLDADTEYSIKVRGINSEGNGVASAAVTATTDEEILPNNAPAFDNSSYLFDDVAIAVNTIIGTVAATDADNDTLSYSLTGTNANSFRINSNGRIRVSTALAYSTTYNFNVVANDGEDTTSVAVSVETVAPPNNAPAFDNSSYSFDDVAIAIGTIVGTVVATDDDDDSISYSLTGTDANDFEIDSDGQITVDAELEILTTYNFNVIADDGEDTASVAISVTTASVVQIQTGSFANQAFVLFEKERNRKTTPEEAGDNDRSTWTTKNTIICDINDKNGDPTGFDHIFVQCSGVTSYVVSLDGVEQGTRTLPLEIEVTEAYPTIDNVAILRNGWQNDLLALDTGLSGSSITLVFTGSNIKINEVLILKKSTILNQNYSELSHSKIDINSNLDKTLSGEFSRAFLSRGDRLRWRSNCQLEFVSNDEDYEGFIDWVDNNPDIVIAHDPELYPWRIYRGKFLDPEYRAPYLTNVLEQGNSVSFRIQENRSVGSRLIQTLKNSFNTEDAQNKYLFFNNCIHLNNNRITTLTGAIDNTVCDNNFKTFSTQTTLIFDISDNGEPTTLTHIWLKASGVSSYRVQTEVAGVWTTQYTITPTQVSYQSWSNSLEKLTGLITDTSVRIIFAGTNIKISEIMLLHHAGGLVSMKEVEPVKIDRNAISSESDSGEIQSRTLSAVRFKWQLNLSAAFAQSNIHLLEDFLDWIDWNPNFVFAERPGSKPWRVYPASFLDNEFKIEMITETIQIGEFLNFQLGER